MPVIVDWPCSMRRVHAEYFLRWTTRSAGISMAGREQIVSANSAVWEVSVTFPREFNGDEVKRFEAKVAQMRGRLNIADLCICDPLKYGSSVSPVQTPFSDGSWFSDGTGFADPSLGTQPVLTTLARPAGVTSLVVDLAGPPVIPRLRTGDMFSVEGFLYRVISTSPGGAVNIEPPLRRPLAAGVALQTDPPHFYGRFATDDEGRRMREYLKWGDQVTVRFIEAFDR